MKNVCAKEEINFGIPVNNEIKYMIPGLIGQSFDFSVCARVNKKDQVPSTCSQNSVIIFHTYIIARQKNDDTKITLRMQIKEIKESLVVSDPNCG